MSKEMCPCGCGLTLKQAILNEMNSPLAPNAEQAEAIIQERAQKDQQITLERAPNLIGTIMKTVVVVGGGTGCEIYEVDGDKSHLHQKTVDLYKNGLGQIHSRDSELAKLLFITSGPNEGSSIWPGIDSVRAEELIREGAKFITVAVVEEGKQ